MWITVCAVTGGRIGRMAEAPLPKPDLMAEARARAHGRGWSHFLPAVIRSDAMQRSKFLVGVVGGVTAVVAVGGVGTYLLAGTESTTALDEYTTVSVGGHKALAGTIVAARTQGKYHPLPWVGGKVSGVTCPTGLKAVAGVSITCTGKDRDGGTVRIPVRVIKADGQSVTWKFER
jgi:hypothetical protein